ncbi:UNVERIFIED_CONTAM: hypothetical protein K2H54_074415 [Gekko kuhli]
MISDLDAGEDWEKMAPTPGSPWLQYHPQRNEEENAGPDWPSGLGWASLLPCGAQQGHKPPMLHDMRRKKKACRAPLGKRAFVFVDDLNMLAKENDGTQPPIELPQQWIDHSYRFDRCNKY